ncbi:MAG: hypothetical protein KKH77_07045 [Candidatus Omnitrophica bacterium]|nr:hypothetical protein [Candidatus Omnitrophota bacterium]MBU1808135.1 hypothetical protein [Candidatus Omnitrophota bacterium]
MEPITIATTVIAAASAIKSGGEASGVDWGKVFGLRPKGGAGGNDPGYTQAVAADMQAEYDKAQAAVNQTNDPDAQQAILNAYDTEKAAWGDPNNPNRNSAIGQSRFAQQIDSILASAKSYSAVPIPAAQSSTTTPVTTIVPANNFNQTGADVFSGVNPKPVTSNPLIDNAPIILVIIGVVVIALVIRKKGK